MRTRKCSRVIINLLVISFGLVTGDDGGDVQLPRDGRQLPNDSEQKYQFELSFPVESDEATNVKNGRRERIEALLSSILLENQALVSYV